MRTLLALLLTASVACGQIQIESYTATTNYQTFSRITNYLYKVVTQEVMEAHTETNVSGYSYLPASWTNVIIKYRATGRVETNKLYYAWERETRDFPAAIEHQWKITGGFVLHWQEVLRPPDGWSGNEWVIYNNVTWMSREEPVCPEKVDIVEREEP